MTDTAIFCGRQVIGVFAASGNTIMTGDTVTHDARMIKHRTNKGGSVVAHTTILSRNDMCTRFANSRGAIVAGGAIAGDAIVREDRGAKRCRVMAEVAVLRGRYMVRR